MSNAASIGRTEHAPDTRLDLTASFPVEYDPSGAVAVFEITDKDDVVIFRVSSGVDANLAIVGQNVEVRMRPDAVSAGVADGRTLAEALALAGSSIVKFNLDMEADDIVDYRFQGELKLLPVHGKFSTAQ